MEEQVRKLGQHRTKHALRLCTKSAGIFSVIPHKNSLTYVSMPAEFLYNLTKNPASHLLHKLCAVLPKIFQTRFLLWKILLLF